MGVLPSIAKVTYNVPMTVLVTHARRLPVRSNWELEYKYGEKLENVSTFAWASSWSTQHDSGDPTATAISPTSWKSGDTRGAVVRMSPRTV